MGIDNKGEQYLCNVCGNEVMVIKAGGGTLACCDKEMQLINIEEYESIARDLPDIEGGQLNRPEMSGKCLRRMWTRALLCLLVAQLSLCLNLQLTGMANAPLGK